MREKHQIVLLKRPKKGDVLLYWDSKDVEERLGEWFVGLDGPHLLDVLHTCPHDMHELMAADDAERLKPVRRMVLRSLQDIRHVALPTKRLHVILLERKLLATLWNAAAAAAWWDPSLPQSRYSAACLLYEYCGEELKRLSNSLSSGRESTALSTARELTRRIDAVRFALSPRGVAAAYSYEPSDDEDQGSEDDDDDARKKKRSANGRLVFQLATSNLASTLIEATRALWGSHKSILIVGESDRGLLANKSQKTGEETGDDSSPSSSGAEFVAEILRLLRSVLRALSTLCPPKTALVSSGHNGIGGDVKNTAAAGEARQRLEIVCNESLNPLVFLLAHAMGTTSKIATTLKTSIESTVRGPFAMLLYLLQWHEDNLVSLFATQKHMIVRAALRWLSPRSDDDDVAENGEDEDVIRRNLVTVVWSFAKRKERAAELAVPEMLHPLLDCLDLKEKHRDVRFTAAGALEYLLRHRSALLKMPMIDVGSSITGTLQAQPEDSPPVEMRRLFDAVFDKLRPTLCILFGTSSSPACDSADIEQLVSSGYLQLTLAACANLAYLVIANRKERPSPSSWLRDQLRARLADLVREDGDAPRRVEVPQLLEPRVKYEAMRLEWALLRLGIHPKNRNGVAYKSLVDATNTLDVRCASAGVVFENVPPNDLKLHFVRDLLRFVCDGKERGDESLRTFAAWILAHHTRRKNDLRHITSQRAFVTLSSLITDDGRGTSLFRSIMDATKAAGRQSEFFKSSNVIVIQDKLLTMRLVANCMANLARSELTTGIVIEQSKLGQTGPLHALNRLVQLGWRLTRTTATPRPRSYVVSESSAAGNESLFLSTGAFHHRELANHEVWTDDQGRTHHKCIPYAVRVDHDERRRRQSRVREAATDERIHFVEPSTDHAILLGCQPRHLEILDEAALALERLAAHTQVRGFFATHGTLACVVGLALHGRFSSSVAFKVLLDTPRNMLAFQVAIARVVSSSDHKTQEDEQPSGPHPYKYIAHRPRWLIADINELIISTLESAPSKRARPDDQKSREAQVAALLALQLATSMLAQDDHKDKYLAHSQINSSFRGKQVVVHTASTGELVSGVCLRLVGYQDAARTVGIIDVVLDSGELVGSIPARHITMSDLVAGDTSPVSSRNDGERLAFFVNPSKAATSNDETSLFLYFVNQSGRFFDTLMACSENVVLTAAACNLCETLTNTIRRYLKSGDVSVGSGLLDRFAKFGERQLTRLVGDCACDANAVESNGKHPIQALRGFDTLESQHGQLYVCLYLLQASVAMYKAKQAATCSHRGFKFGVPSLMHNALSAIHAQVFDASIGELSPETQRYVVGLCKRIQQPSMFKASPSDFSDAENENDVGDGHDQRSGKSVYRKPSFNTLSAHDDDTRSGNNIVHSAFRAVLAVLELARAVDNHRTTVRPESQPILLGEMLHCYSQKNCRVLEEKVNQFAALENDYEVVKRRGSDVLGDQTAPPESIRKSLGDDKGQSLGVRKVLFGSRGLVMIDSPRVQNNSWSHTETDDAPLYSKLREISCQIVSLGVSSRGMRLDDEHYAQHSAIRSSLRLLSALGTDHLLAEKVNRASPTSDKRFVRSLVRCIKWHPYWHQWHTWRKEQARKVKAAKDEDRDLSPRPVSSDLPTIQNMGDLLAVEACKLVQMLSSNLNQRHRIVFPDLSKGKHHRRDRRRAGAEVVDATEEHSDEETRHGTLENEINAAMKERSRNGCLPVLSVLIGAARGDVDLTVRSAAVAAVKEIAINSTICSEAICAHSGVKNLVVAAHVGDHSLRRNVAFIFSLIAMMPSIRGELLNNYQALLLLLQLQALKDNPYLKDDNQVVAHAGLALKYLSEEPALVYLKALELCVKRVEVWNMSVNSQKPWSSSTVGVSLLGHGYRELLDLALKGLDDAASHSEMAGLLIENDGIDLLVRCLCIREAGILMPTARILAALAYHVVAHEKHQNSSVLVCKVIDHLLLIVWPFAHRAARTLQTLCREKRKKRLNIQDDLFLSPLGVTLVPVTSALVGLAATTIERAACDHGLGDYLVQNGAMEALVARLTPDGYKHDEDVDMFGLPLESSSFPNGRQPSDTSVRPRSTSTNSASTTANSSGGAERTRSVSLRSERPVVQVLSAIAQLAHNAPHCLPSGKTERTLSMVCAFHHSTRCRHLAMLALWRIRPTVGGRHEAGCLRGGPEDSLSPPPPIYWDDDDVVTWLGCIGFGSLGKAIRQYLARPQSKLNADVVNSIPGVQGRESGGWTRSQVDKTHDPYGQATAGEKLLALTHADFSADGRLRLSATQRSTLQIHAFGSELRELHLRMREFLQAQTYDVRLPRELLSETGLVTSDVLSPPKTPDRKPDTIVVLTAAEVRRYHALYDEAIDVCQQAGPGSGAVGLKDLVQVAVSEAKHAYDEHLHGNIVGARKYAQHVKANAEKVKDAVALHRVKHSAERGGDAAVAPDIDTTSLDELGSTVMSEASSSTNDLSRWGDTLWYELSSAPTVEAFNQSRDVSGDIVERLGSVVIEDSSESEKDARVSEYQNLAPPSGSECFRQLKKSSSESTENSHSGSHLGDQRLGSSRSDTCADLEDLCLWPTEGVGTEAAQVRELRRRKRTPAGLLQKVSKAPIRDPRGLSHLYEVRFIDARVWLPGKKTALMMCAKEGDTVMVSLLLDSVDIQVKEHKFANLTGSMVYECLPTAMRPDAIDEHGNSALHHALFSMHRLLKMVNDKRCSAFDVSEHIERRISIVRTLIERVAWPHGAACFAHGTARSNSTGSFEATKTLFEETSRDDAPRDSLALVFRCYALTQREAGLGAELSIDDEKKPLTHPLKGLENVAIQLDDIIKLMFESAFDMRTQAIRAAEANPELLARIRYVFVQHSRPAGALKQLLEVAPDVFLKGRRNGASPGKGDKDAPPVPKVDKPPWEAPVFALKRLQKETNKLWTEGMIFTQNRQLLGHVAFLIVVTFVTVEIVGGDLAIVSRDAVQQALRTRFVEEEWEPANGFLEIATPDNWWAWAEGPLLSAVYEETLPTWEDDGRLRSTSLSNSNANSTDDASDDRFPLLGGLAFAVGPPALRMLGTVPDESVFGACSYNPGGARLEGDGYSCFSFFDESVQLDSSLKWQSAFGSAMAEAAFEFSRPVRGWLGLEAPPIYGHQSYYPGVGGYVAAFPKDQKLGEEMLAELKNSSWLSQNTRAIVLEFMAYTPSDHHSFNLLTRVRLLAEFTPTGAVLCSGQIRAVRLWLYRTARDFVRAFFEIVWLIAVCGQFWSEVVQLAAAFQRDVVIANRSSSHRIRAQVDLIREGIANYASVHFNLIDLGHFHIFLLLVFFHTASLTNTYHVDWDRLASGDENSRSTLTHLSTASSAVQYAEVRLFLLGIYIFLTFLKLLDRMRVRESLHVLIIEEMFKKIFTFLIVMSVCVIGFSFTAFAARLGGAQGPMGGTSSGVSGGDSFVAAFVSQMRQLIGEIDYETAYNAAPHFGLIFCVITFMVLPVLLMNLLVAIMLEAYETVRDYAAARFCYLQLMAYSDDYQAHDGFMGAPANLTSTHWLALGASATFFPLLVLERVASTFLHGAKYVWRDLLYPTATRRGKNSARLDSSRRHNNFLSRYDTVESIDNAHNDLRLSRLWRSAVQKLRTIRVVTPVRIHPTVT